MHLESQLCLPWDLPNRALQDVVPPKEIKGHVQWFKVCRETGEKSLEYEAENTITYLATNIMAKSIAGLPDYKITHIYGEHADPGFSGYSEGSLNGLSSTRSDTIDDLRTSPRSTTGAEEPVLITSFATTTENPPGTPVSDYTNNIATFTAIFSDPSLDGEIFVGAGLMTLVSGTELLFAHQYRPALIKLISFDIQVSW